MIANVVGHDAGDYDDDVDDDNDNADVDVYDGNHAFCF
jgi:hypothetical protein